MKRMQSFFRRSAALAGLLLALAVPSAVYSADQAGPANRVAPVGTPIQQVNYASCPNGNCYNGGSGSYGNGGGWNRGWGGNCQHGNCWGGTWRNGGSGGCSTCNGVGIFGCPCHSGTTNGYAFVRPPAGYPLNRVSNAYNHYYSARLAGAPVAQNGLQYPMVYQPTDTAQLGFYYQAVPRWYYRPEMLPPPPSPYWPMGMNGGYGGGYASAGGTNWDGTTNAPTTAPSPVPTTAPTPPVAPPPPAEPQVKVPEPEALFFPDRIRRR